MHGADNRVPGETPITEAQAAPPETQPQVVEGADSTTSEIAAKTLNVEGVGGEPPAKAKTPDEAPPPSLQGRVTPQPDSDEEVQTLAERTLLGEEVDGEGSEVEDVLLGADQNELGVRENRLEEGEGVDIQKGSEETPEVIDETPATIPKKEADDESYRLDTDQPDDVIQPINEGGKIEDPEEFSGEPRIYGHDFSETESLGKQLPATQSAYVEQTLILLQKIVIEAQRELAQQEKLEEKDHREVISQARDAIRQELQKEARKDTEEILALETRFQEANIETREQLVQWVETETMQYHDEIKTVLENHIELQEDHREANQQELNNKLFMYRGQLTLLDKILTEARLGKKFGVDVLDGS